MTNDKTIWLLHKPYGLVGRFLIGYKQKYVSSMN